MMLAYDMGNKNYGSFFYHSKTDTLNILVTDDQNKIGYWEECKNDSLLLKRYKLTKYNVEKTQKSFGFLLAYSYLCNRKRNYRMMTSAISVNISLPRNDMSFMRQLAKRMGWSISETEQPARLYDPESDSYLNDETMEAIREVEAGHVTRCKDMSELLELV